MYLIATTPTGKPKITDRHGFAIATAPDSQKETVKHIEFLVRAGNNYERMKEIISRLKTAVNELDGDERQWAIQVCGDATELLQSLES